MASEMDRGAKYGRLGPLFAQARALFDDVEIRLYIAAVLSRTGLRNPFGARRAVPLLPFRPTQLARNDSKARVLMVNVELTGAPQVIFSSSPTAGATDFQIPGNAVSTTPTLVALRPEEYLFGTSAAGIQSAVVGQEWY